MYVLYKTSMTLSGNGCIINNFWDLGGGNCMTLPRNFLNVLCKMVHFRTGLRKISLNLDPSSFSFTIF